MLELLWQCYDKDSDEILNLQGEKSYAFAELLERRSNHLNICYIQLSAGNFLSVDTHRFAGYHTMPSHSHICQVAPDDRLRLDDVLSIEDDVLRATEDARPRDPVSTRCFYVLRFVKGNVWQLHDAWLCKCIGITATMSRRNMQYCDMNLFFLINISHISI